MNLILTNRGKHKKGALKTLLFKNIIQLIVNQDDIHYANP